MGEKFRYRFYVPFVDTDAAGVVHFSNYPRYVERTEEELLRSGNLNYRVFNERKIWLPRVEFFIQYLSPLRHNDLVEVVMWISEIKEKSVRYSFEIHNLYTNKLSAKGTLTVVCAEINGRAIACPHELVEVWKKYHIEEKDIIENY